MSDWQPIETAPRDRELILFFPETKTRIPLYRMIRVDRYPVSYPRQPTHWMPLPEVPR